MQTINRIAALRDATATFRRAGRTIALVPTMGALHAGHMQLVEHARTLADEVVVSIFVNPTQFGPSEDLDSYPRQLQADAALCSDAGVAILWAPTVDEVYGDHFATTVSVGGVSDGLCGAKRPGHFDGVALIVAKLLNQVDPEFALFGEKDYQQLAVIRRMVADLDFRATIMGVPTVREADGLALSSRNAYLSEDERERAVALPNAMREAIRHMESGDDIGSATASVEQELIDAGFASVDYVELRDAATLERLEVLDRPARLLAAATIGTTRLIDNMPVLPSESRQQG